MSDAKPEEKPTPEEPKEKPKSDGTKKKVKKTKPKEAPKEAPAPDASEENKPTEQAKEVNSAESAKDSTTAESKPENAEKGVDAPKENGNAEPAKTKAESRKASADAPATNVPASQNGSAPKENNSADAQKSEQVVVSEGVNGDGPSTEVKVVLSRKGSRVQEMDVPQQNGPSSVPVENSNSPPKVDENDPNVVVLKTKSGLRIISSCEVLSPDPVPEPKMADEDDWLSAATEEPAAATEEAPADEAAVPAEGEEAAVEEEAIEEEEEDIPQKRRIRSDRPLIFKYWKRPVFLQYAYLYDYRHNYYDDVMDYLDKRQRGISREIPRAQTWAERALRTYNAKSKHTMEYHQREKDIDLLSEIRTSNRLYKFHHSKGYYTTKYAQIL